mgnify:CR=1 FL=1
MGPAFANRGMKKGPTVKSDRFFNIKNQKRSLASKPFMLHFDINYIISKQGKESYDSFPCFISSKILNASLLFSKVLEL